MSPQAPQAVGIVIPPSIISKVDISRLLNEVIALDHEMAAASIRTRAGATIAASSPVLSDQLTDFLAANRLEITDTPHRTQLITCLRRLKAEAPIIHITFAATADQHSLQQLAAWIRNSIHSQAVISVGLQPSLIGGAYIRTTNHVFDFSVRTQLAKSRGVIAKDLEMISGGR